MSFGLVMGFILRDSVCTDVTAGQPQREISSGVGGEGNRRAPDWSPRLDFDDKLDTSNKEPFSPGVSRAGRSP